ncbi:MAG: hypothetical protein WKF83_15470 [Nocardioidaceae bacterium]
MNALTLEIILRVVFDVTDLGAPRPMRPMVNRLVQIGPGVLLAARTRGCTDSGPWRRFFATVQAFDEGVDTPRSPSVGPAATSRRADDVLSRLLLVGHDGAVLGVRPRSTCCDRRRAARPARADCCLPATRRPPPRQCVDVARAR